MRQSGGISIFDNVSSGTSTSIPPRISRSRSPSSTRSSSSRKRPQFERGESIKEKTAQFFGIPADETNDPANDKSNTRWQRKRLRHLEQQYGLKLDSIPSTAAQTPSLASFSGSIGDLVADLPPVDGYSVATSVPKLDRDAAKIARALSVEQRPGGQEKKESVMKMAVDAVESIARGTPFRRSRKYHVNRSPGSSFSIRRDRALLASNSSFPTARPMQCLPEVSTEDAETSFTAEPDRPDISYLPDPNENPLSPRKQKLRRIQLPTINQFNDEPSISTSPSRPETLNLYPNKSKLQRAVRFPVESKPKLKIAGMNGENIPLQQLHSQKTVDEEDELFFDNGGRYVQPQKPASFIIEMGPDHALLPQQRDASTMPPPFPKDLETPVRMRDKLIAKERNIQIHRVPWWHRFRRSFRQTFPDTAKSLSSFIVDRSKRRKLPRNLPIGGPFKIHDPLNQHLYIEKQLQDESLDDRPFFTYFVTTVQIIIMLLALYRYGFGTSFNSNYFDVTERKGDVMAASLSNVHIVVWEQNNIWIGPRYADLVHMGAKYSPCMRRDLRIMELIEEERRIESEDTGCCISAEGCYQTSECAKQFSRFIKWTNDSKSSTPSRAVCGQDPRYCRNPESVPPHQWSKDISKWKTCTEVSTRIPSSEAHMKCEIRGRPCCIQMHGQCRITTREYCDFVQGYYHENATLCSQVSCLGDICGNTPFLRHDIPDQLYRLFTPLFIHAGLIQIVITVWIQGMYMRRFELMIGWVRLAIIYFVSGMGGYLASATFVPYMPQVGPVASQSGVLGAMVVNVLYNWNLIGKPMSALCCHLGIAIFLFVCGFLPFIDNFAQVFGFLFGAMLACALIPYIEGFSLRSRLIIVVSSLTATVGLFIILFLLFAVTDPSSLPDLSWMSCIFKGERLCDQQSLKLKDWLPI